jgi:hypothetical protein
VLRKWLGLCYPLMAVPTPATLAWRACEATWSLLMMTRALQPVLLLWRLSHWACWLYGRPVVSMRWMKHGEHSMQGRHGARDERRGAWLGERQRLQREGAEDKLSVASRIFGIIEHVTWSIASSPFHSC